MPVGISLYMRWYNFMSVTMKDLCRCHATLWTLPLPFDIMLQKYLSENPEPLYFLQSIEALLRIYLYLSALSCFHLPSEKRENGKCGKRKTRRWIHEGNRASGQARENKAVYGVCLLNNAVEMHEDENSLPELNILLCFCGLLLSSKNTFLISTKSLSSCVRRTCQGGYIVLSGDRRLTWGATWKLQREERKKQTEKHVRDEIPLAITWSFPRECII